MVENGALCPSVTSTFANDLESNEARLWTQLQAQTRSHSSQHMIFRYFDEAQASLCKFADSSESSLTAEILILIALSSNYTCTNVQTHQSLRPGVNTGATFNLTWTDFSSGRRTG